MSKKKKNARERRAEEREIIRQMDEEMKKNENDNNLKEVKNNKDRESDKNKKTKDEDHKMYCTRCGAVMIKGVCPECGNKTYVPMDEKKTKKIRWIVGSICIVLLIIWIIVTKK